MRNDDGIEREQELRSELSEYQRRLTLAESQLQHVSQRSIEITTEAGSRAQAADVHAQQMANVAREEQVLAGRHATQSIMIGSEAMALRDQRDVATGEATTLYNHLQAGEVQASAAGNEACLLYTSPSPRDLSTSRMPSSA